MSSRCRTCHFAPCRCEDLRVGFAGTFAGKAAWPILSDAAGVHPSQVAEATAEASRLGTHIEFTRDGRAVFQSLKHQQEYSRKIGLVDRSREITMPKVKTMRERSPRYYPQGEHGIKSDPSPH